MVYIDQYLKKKYFFSGQFYLILSSFEFWILRSFWGGLNQQQIEVWVVKMQFLSDLGVDVSWKKCDFPEYKQITYTDSDRHSH